MGPGKKVKKLLQKGLRLVSAWALDFRICDMCLPISSTLEVMINWLTIIMVHNLPPDF